MKISRDVDKDSYKVELADTENGQGVIPYYDVNNIMENITLQKYGDRYAFLKYYFDSAKAMEFITFKYHNKSI